MVKFGVYLDLVHLCLHFVEPGAILFPLLDCTFCLFLFAK